MLYRHLHKDDVARLQELKDSLCLKAEQGCRQVVAGCPLLAAVEREYGVESYCPRCDGYCTSKLHVPAIAHISNRRFETEQRTITPDGPAIRTHSMVRTNPSGNGARCACAFGRNAYPDMEEITLESCAFALSPAAGTN